MLRLACLACLALLSSVAAAVAPETERAPAVGETPGLVVATVPGTVKDVQPGLQEPAAADLADYLRLHCDALGRLDVIRWSAACVSPER